MQAVKGNTAGMPISLSHAKRRQDLPESWPLAFPGRGKLNDAL